ncbi:RidA family protein [Microbulbifer sp. TRSA007]|uniref:RidA family protein n=1 Tax=Microbulbifer sp. TRSA007 TaxID=3243384 RepID=UPI004039C3FB
MKIKTSSINALISTFFTITLSSFSYAKDAEQVKFLNPTGSVSKLPFSEAVKVGNQLFLSGQIGLSPETKRLAQGGFAAETKQTLDNIKQTLERYDYEMKDVVKCTVILTDIKNFPEFNNIYQKAFASPYPARTTFAVESLALDAQIEIECIAAK